MRPDFLDDLLDFAGYSSQIAIVDIGKNIKDILNVVMTHVGDTCTTTNGGKVLQKLNGSSLAIRHAIGRERRTGGRTIGARRGRGDWSSSQIVDSRNTILR